MPLPTVHEEMADGPGEAYRFRDEEPEPNGRQEAAQLLHPEEFDRFDHYEELDYEEEHNPRATPQPSLAKRLGLPRWITGPEPPRKLSIDPVFPRLQRWPVEFLDRVLPDNGHKLALLAVYLLLWMAAFGLPLQAGTRVSEDESGNYVVNLECTDTLWERSNLCGLNGRDCRPFANSSLAFRCPASCGGVQVLDPHMVGPLDVVYRPLVIGDKTYRGDSYICSAALHAGIVNNQNGGCGRLNREGRTNGFTSSTANGIESIAFDSYFPIGFTFDQNAKISCRPDLRHTLLYVSVFFTTVFSAFTTSPRLQFFIVFSAIFAHVGLVSDPAQSSFRNISVLPDRIAATAGHFIPAAFISVIMYWATIKKTLRGLDAQLDKCAFWLGGFWVGALSNYTFSWIPIQNLTGHVLAVQTGANIAIVVLLIILAMIVSQQIYGYWLENRLLPYVMLYSLIFVGILVCVAIPGVNLRLHHYIVGLILLPGTSLQTRSSLLYQGILLGLFVNGAARWGFDSILQTKTNLRGDPGAFDKIVPTIDEPKIGQLSSGPSISFSWGNPPAPDLVGMSILVNDVERYREFFAHDSVAHNFTWERARDLDLPEYFRFAYMKDGHALDYSKAGIWAANDSWTM